MKMWDEKTNKPELPRQFYQHHRHLVRLLSSYPFLILMDKRLGDTIERKKYLRKARGSVNADRSKLSRSKLEAETEWSLMWDGRKVWRMMVQKNKWVVVVGSSIVVKKGAGERLSSGSLSQTNRSYFYFLFSHPSANYIWSILWTK